jgi:type IV pilus assembly protein PilX
MRNPTLNAMKNPARQSGVVLVTGLLFLLVVTIIAVTAANNSTLGLKMSGSMQDSYRSFQSAEAGVYAALGLAGTDAGTDLFRPGQDVVAVAFPKDTNHPLRNQVGYPNDLSVDVDVVTPPEALECVRPPSDRGGNTIRLFKCEYYRVVSEHAEPGRARTKVQLGIVKTVIKG